MVLFQEGEFRTFRTPPSVCHDSWEFRKIFREGSVMPNALTVADIDDDGVDEFVLGTTEGQVCCLKSMQREPLFSYALNGTVSLVLWGGSMKQVIAVCMEGKATLIDNCTPPFANLHISHMKIPANCTCGVLHRTSLFLGSSDRRIYVYDMQLQQQNRSCFIKSQIFSMSMLYVGVKTPLLVVPSTHELSFVDASREGVSKWADGNHGADTETALSGGIVWQWQYNKGTAVSAAGTEAQRLPVAVSSCTGGDAAVSYVALAREDGLVWLFTVFENTASSAMSNVESDSKLKQLEVDGTTVFVKWVWTVKLEALLCSVVCDPVPNTQGVRVICSAVSGAIYVTDAQKNALVTQVKADLCAFGRVLSSRWMSHDRTALVLFGVSIDEAGEYEVPCSTLGEPGWVSSEPTNVHRYHAEVPGSFQRASESAGRDGPQLEEAAAAPPPEVTDGMALDASLGVDMKTILRVGRELFPEVTDERAISQRVLRLLTEGYTAQEWDRLRTAAHDGAANDSLFVD